MNCKNHDINECEACYSPEAEANENATYLITEQKQTASNREYYGKLMRKHLADLQDKYSNHAEIKHELDVIADYLFYLYE